MAGPAREGVRVVGNALAQQGMWKQYQHDHKRIRDENESLPHANNDSCCNQAISLPEKLAVWVN
jgi:hypothetical protein